MLPCRETCPYYHDGCHKTCQAWQQYQAQLQKQHQEQKEYLKLHNEICSTVIRQCRTITGNRHAYI